MDGVRHDRVSIPDVRWCPAASAGVPSVNQRAAGEGWALVQDEAGPADAAAVAEKLAVEFFEALELLYVRVGEPALRTVAARSPYLSASNLSDLLSGKRKALPGQDVTTELVKALLHARPASEVKPVVKEWEERWARARMAQRTADRAAAEQRRTATAAAEDIIADANRVLAEARTEADNLLARAAAELRESRAKTARLLEEAAHRSAELEAEWHAEVGNRRQSLDRELSEKRQQAEAQVKEMAAWAEEVRAETEMHRGRIIEAARSEVEAGRDRIATETAQAIEHVRIETENMRTAARAEAEETREAAEAHALEIVKDADERAAQLYRAAQANAEALVERAQQDADRISGKATVDYFDGWHDEPGEARERREQANVEAEVIEAAHDGSTAELAELLANFKQVIKMRPTASSSSVVSTTSSAAPLHRSSPEPLRLFPGLTAPSQEEEFPDSPSA